MPEQLKSIDKGVLFMLASALLGAINGAVAKFLSQSIDPFEIVFYRNLIGFILIFWSLKKFSVPVDTSKLHLLFLRGFLGAVAMILFFYTIATIPLGEAVVLNKTSPFFVTIIAYYLMKESINLRIFIALLIGFLGIIFIMKPFGLEISLEHIIGVLGGFFAATAYATIKKIKDIYDTRVIMLSFVAFGVLIPFCLFLFTPYVTIRLHSEPEIWALIGMMALFSTASQWFLTKAYSLSKASIIGVVGYTNIPFAIGFGVMLGDSLPDTYTFVGILLIVIGGVAVSKKS